MRSTTLVEQVVFDKNAVGPSVLTRECNFYLVFVLINFFAGIVQYEQTVLKRLYHFEIETFDKFNVHPLLNFFQQKLKIPIGSVNFFKPVSKRLGSQIEINSFFCLDSKGPTTDTEDLFVLKIICFMVLG